MLNYIWSFIILCSIIFSCLNGNVICLTESLFAAVSKGVNLSITLTGIICFWSGIMQIAEDCNITDFLKRILQPLTNLLFPDIRKNSAALTYIIMNISANILGLGNAATPFGILAVKELDKENSYSLYASDEMCRFVVMNTASLQLIPSTVIGLRAAYGSQSPSEIIIAVWITSVSALLAGIFSTSILKKRWRYE